MNQISYSNTTSPIDSVWQRKDFWDSYPSCQRDYVWKLWQQQRLIDTILRGLPMPSIVVIPEYDELMGQKNWIVDGQQRLKTILRFRNGDFGTAKKFHNERDLSPLEPGRTYDQLSLGLRTRFDNYPLPVSVIHNVDVKQIGIVFRRLQYQSKLTLAERLFSYDGTTKDLSTLAEKHSFWTNVYSGDRTRKQVFQAGIYIILLEQLGIFANTTTPRLIDQLVSRNEQWKFTSDDVKRSLTAAEHLFWGASVNSMAHIVPIYQCVKLLEQHGYSLLDAPKGALSAWWMKLRSTALEARSDFSFNLTKVNAQRQFWQTNLPIVIEALQVEPRDQQRFFSEKTKIDAWIGQNGKCAICGRELRYQDAVAHHDESHESGGKTTIDNCKLVHPKCHTKIHSQVNTTDFAALNEIELLDEG